MENLGEGEGMDWVGRIFTEYVYYEWWRIRDVYVFVAWFDGFVKEDFFLSATTRWL